jgi:hypothetical protein
LAQATNTRIDSACKHIQQCRVSQDHMTMLVGKDSDELIRNKYRYCVHKDEMVVGITRGLGENKDMKRFQNSAYPRIISNLGKMLDADGLGNACDNCDNTSKIYEDKLCPKLIPGCMITCILTETHRLLNPNGS